MSADNIGIIATTIATFITLVTSIIIIVRHFTKLESKIDGIRDGVNQNIRQSNGMLGLYGTLIGLLSEKGALDKKDFGTIIKDFTQMGRVVEISPNPISAEEANRLNGYIRKAKQGGVFTREEVEEYSSIVKTLETEKPNDPVIWPLVALAALLLGLYLINKK